MQFLHLPHLAPSVAQILKSEFKSERRKVQKLNAMSAWGTSTMTFPTWNCNYRTLQWPAKLCNKEHKTPRTNGATHPHRHVHLQRSQGGMCRCRPTLRCTHTERAEECHNCVCLSGNGLRRSQQLQVRCAREEMKIWIFLCKVWSSQ